MVTWKVNTVIVTTASASMDMESMGNMGLVVEDSYTRNDNILTDLLFYIDYFCTIFINFPFVIFLVYYSLDFCIIL